MNYKKSEAKDASKAQFRGVWAAITTPFTPDGEIDEAGLRHNMRHLTDGLAIEGIFCTGVMGEFWSLTKEERKRVVEIVVQEARGKCKVIAHTAHHSAKETVELTQHAEEVGADFAILMNPYYPPCNDAMVYDYFKYVCSRVNIGVWMFDAEYAGYGLSVDVTNKIADIENICGIKLPRPLEHYTALKKAMGDKIVISEPTEGLWMKEMKEFGQTVHMSSPVPFLMQTPNWRPMHDYTALGLAGKFDEAEVIAKTMQPLRDIAFKWLRSRWVNEKLIPITYMKAWSELLGMAGGPVRTPLINITEQERATLKAEIEKTGLLAKVSVKKAA
jgi:4-hydroxy-tetrahydrodipicolinate synthase